MLLAHSKVIQDTVTPTELGKLCFNMFCYGAGKTAFSEIGIQNPFAKPSGRAAKFKKQWVALTQRLLETYPAIVAYSKQHKEEKGGRWHPGCALSLLLQTCEAYIIHNLMKEFDPAHVKIYEFDGLLIDLPPAVVQGELDRLYNSNRLPIKFCIKPRGTPLSALPIEEIPEPNNTDEGPNGPILWTTHLDAAQGILTHFPNQFIVIDEEIWSKNRGLYQRDSKKDGNLISFVMECNLRVKDDPADRSHENIRTAKCIVETLKSQLIAHPQYHRSKYDICQRWIGHVCFRNGHLQFSSGQFTPYSPDDVVLQYINIDYTPDSDFDNETRRVVGAILDCLGPHRKYFLHLMARAVAGHYRDKQWIILKSDRNSGKSLLQKLFTLLGSYSANCNVPTVSDQTDIARTLGTFVLRGGDTHGIMWSNETANHIHKPCKLDGQIIKMLNGGDPLSARTLGYDPVVCHFLKIPVFCMNQVPEVTPADALQSCKIIHMPYTYVNPSELLENGPIAKEIDPTLEPWILAHPMETITYLVSLLLETYKWSGPIPNLGPEEDIVSVTTVSVFMKYFSLSSDPKAYLPKQDVYSKLLGVNELSSEQKVSYWLKKRWGILPSKRQVDGKSAHVFVGLSEKELPPDDNDSLNESNIVTLEQE
jgi:hypothetical protein